MKREYYKHGGRVVCYINITPAAATVCTGRPSDPVCISWRYPISEIEKARTTAREFFANYTRV